jgi:hypothetical protein
VRPRLERWLAPLLCAATAWLFFFEYLPPVRRVHMIWDVAAYHYPLLNQAFLTLLSGEFPEWDPVIYCGASFAGNIQAQLFYPPTWLLFAAHAGAGGLRFVGVEIYLAAHFALSLWLAWLWLRARGLGRVGSACGAAAFAFCGFRMNELQHLGGNAAMTWFPLAFLGLEEASRRECWKPLWKTAVAAALCFLAGSPFVWVSFCLCVVLYALALRGRKWLAAGAVAAIAFSIPLTLVQLLPTMEAAGMQVKRITFGGGVPRPLAFRTLIAPNYFDFARTHPPVDEEFYFYLGLPVLFGCAWLLWRRRWTAAAPALAMLAGSWLIMLNPFGLVARLFHILTPLDRMVREWNLLACLPVTGALLAAAAIDDALVRGAGKRVNRFLPWAALAAAVAWCLRQFLIWRSPTQPFQIGWTSLWEVAMAMACFLAVLACLRAERRPRLRAALAAALLALVLVDYKVYGTSRRFTSSEGNLDRVYANDARLGGDEFQGMDNQTFSLLRRNADYRLLHLNNPSQPDLRHYLLATPQGSDPIISARYQEWLGNQVDWRSDRTFQVDLNNQELLRQLGVRWILAYRDSPEAAHARALPHLRLVDESPSFTAVFEFLGALPAWRWTAGEARVLEWESGRRHFRVDSLTGGEFRLLEEAYPGWSVKVDGVAAPVIRGGDSFQSVRAPAGRHEIEWTYRARGLRAGAVVSCAFWVLLVVWAKRR